MSTKTAAKTAKTAATAKTAKVKAAAEAKKYQTAMKATALELTPAQLVERITTARFSESKGTEQAEHFRNLFEAAKMEASNQRVLLARACYLLAAHPEVGGKAINYSAAARAVVGPESEWEATEDDADYGKAVERIRVWLTIQAKAGAALEAKGLVWNQGAPMEEERAIVEASHDVTVRAASAKKNAKVRAKVQAPKDAGKGKGESEDETDDAGVLKSKVETFIPTADGIIAALETVRRNVARFNTEARFTSEQIAAVEELLAGISVELVPMEAPAAVDAA